MPRPLAKSPFVLLALRLWILVCPAALAEDDDPKALDRQVNELIEQGKYQEAIPIAQRAVEMAKRTQGSEQPETAAVASGRNLLRELKPSGEARAGEGVMGLRRGFIQAGARNLLMTLWPISDEVTVQIMSNFYEAAHNTWNAPEALAEVQRNWPVKLRTAKGLAQAVNLAGPFIMKADRFDFT